MLINDSFIHCKLKLMENYIWMYPPHCQCGQNIKISDSVDYYNKGWTVDPARKYMTLFKAEQARRAKEVEESKKTKKNTSKLVEKTKIIKTNPTSTTKKTVSKSTNKNGDTVIKVS